MSALAKKDQERLLAHVEKQGVKVTATKKGYLMRLPNGQTTMLHKSESDWRGPANLRARLKAAGVSWPTDIVKDSLPAYITKGTMTDAVLDRFRSALGDPLPDEVGNCSELGRRVYADKKFPDMTTTYRALYRLGYRPSSMRDGKAVPWLLRVEAEYPEITKARTSVPLALVPPVDEAAPANLEREFLDTADSWTLDLKDVGPVPVQVLVATMRSAGLDLEVRVWKHLEA